MTLALFDFDGTITSRDTMLEFARFARGDGKFLAVMSLLLPALTLYKLRLYPNERLKESFLSLCFSGMDEVKFRELAREYSLTMIDAIVPQRNRALLDRHRSSGDRVVVVSASVDCWVSPWCEKEKLESITTQLEFSEGKVTGKLSTPNCYGPEKVRRIQSYLDLPDYDRIYVYGDSRGDREMLALRRHHEVKD